MPIGKPASLKPDVTLVPWIVFRPAIAVASIKARLPELHRPEHFLLAGLRPIRISWERDLVAWPQHLLRDGNLACLSSRRHTAMEEGGRRFSECPHVPRVVRFSERPHD